MNAKKYTLTVTCPDKSGLIASITNSIASSKGNILNLAQHTATDIPCFSAGWILLLKKVLK